MIPLTHILYTDFWFVKLIGHVTDVLTIILSQMNYHFSFDLCLSCSLKCILKRSTDS